MANDAKDSYNIFIYSMSVTYTAGTKSQIWADQQQEPCL